MKLFIFSRLQKDLFIALDNTTAAMHNVYTTSAASFAEMFFKILHGKSNYLNVSAYLLEAISRKL